MLQIIENFEKKTPSNIKLEIVTLKSGINVNMYTIKSVHDLTQFIGFGKYINNQNYNVFLRGQAELYGGSLIPSLYRGRTSVMTCSYFAK